MHVPSTYEATKSTKGASKERRDKINAEIQNLRELLPLPSNTRQRLGQLQLMALVCVYIRKATYFKNTFDCIKDEMKLPRIDFSSAISGFIIMMTQNGKLLYLSENATDYLGHSMEDLLIQGDSVYDIIDNKDHLAIRETLETPKNSNSLNKENREFLCRINVNKNARRQMRFGDQKLVLVSGHYFSYIPLSSSEIPVFLAVCSPVVMPETRECVASANCRVYTTQHSLDFKYIHLDRLAEFYLGTDRNSVLNQSMSWYDFVHPEDLAEVSKKHIALSTNNTEKSAILLIRILNFDHSSDKSYNWTHVVLQVKDPENCQKPMIICTNQVLTESEARILHQNKWLYDNFSKQAKMQYGFPFNGSPSFVKTSPSSSENGNNSSTNSSDSNQQITSSSPPLQQIVLNNNASNSSNGTKRSKNRSNSPNSHYYLNNGNINGRSRISSPEYIVSSSNSSSSPGASGSHTANSPLMSTNKTDLKYLINENSNNSVSSNLTSEAYSNANLANYGINCLSPNNMNSQTNNLSTSSVSPCILNNGHSLHSALNAMAPLDIRNDQNTSITEAAVAAAAAAGHNGPFNTHNLLQYSPHSNTLSSYSSFVSPGSVSSTTSLFTHSPQQASSVITNTTPPATPPEIIHRHSSSSSSSSSSNNSSLNSNSSSLNGVVTNVTSNKRSLNSSSTNSLSSLARHSPEPKRAYLGQHSSISHYDNGYSNFNHHYAYNNGYNQTNSLSTHPTIHQQSKFQTHPHQHQLIQQAHSNQINQANPQAFFNSQSPSHSQLHQQNSTGTQNQYSFSSVYIAANNFSDLMPTMSGYYNAAAAAVAAHHPAHTNHHQFNQLTHHNQLNSAHQQILPNTVSTSAMAAAAAAAAAVSNSNVKNSDHHHSSINQNHHLNYHHHTNSHLTTVAAVAGQKLSLFNKNIN